jgi:hypothetical protein
MKSLCHYLLFLFLFVNGTNAFSQAGNVSVHLDAGDKPYLFIACLETMGTNPGITAVAHPPITPEDDPVNDLSINLRRKTKRGYNKVVATIVSRPLLSNDTIAVTRSTPLIDTLDLRQHYMLYRGDYRIRVTRKVWINGREAILSSKWIDFHVEEKIETGSL